MHHRLVCGQKGGEKLLWMIKAGGGQGRGGGGVWDGAGLRSCLMHLVEHQLSGDARLRAVLLAGPPLERRHVLLDHLVEEHGG